MDTVKRALKINAVLLLFFFAGGLLSVFTNASLLLYSVPTLYYFTLSVSLAGYFFTRVIGKDLRSRLVLIALMINALIVLRGAKYFVFADIDIAARHLWYAYYIPILGTAQLSLDTALYMNGPQEGKHLISSLTRTVTAAVIILIMTNDIHQLVFRFAPGFADWDGDHGFGPGYLAMLVWVLLLFLSFMALLLRRCRLSTVRRLVWVPLMPFFSGAVYFILYALGRWITVGGELLGEFPEAVCFTAAGIWIDLIIIHLIPSNEDYAELFRASHIGARITDSCLRTVYVSDNAAELTDEQLAGSVVMLDKNTRLHRKEIRGGYVHWQDDVSELRRINSELESMRDQLMEEAELLRLENELREEHSRIEQKMKIYDAISSRVRPQSRMIAALSEDGGDDPEKLSLICLYATYIKRCANMMLAAAENGGALRAAELQLAVRGSLRVLHARGIPAECSLNADRILPSGSVLDAYEIIENCLEQSFAGVKGAYCAINGGTVRLILEGTEIVLPEHCKALVKTEDGDSYVSIDLEKGGVA